MIRKESSAKHQILSPANRLSLNSIFFASISGVMLFLSFPRYGSGYLAWVALVPLFWALKDIRQLRYGLLLGFITGIISHIGLIYWIVYVVVNYGHLPIYLGIIIMLLLAAYLSLYTAVFAAGIVLSRGKFALYCIAPVLWVCLEYGKSYLLTGFPWENLGYSQYLNRYIIQSADIFGVYGLSFIIVLVNITLFEVVFNKTKRVFLPAGVAVLVVACVIIYGIGRLTQIDNILKELPDKEISLIQGNIDQSIKWNERFQKSTVNIYEQLSLQNTKTDEGIIVWPETALPFNYQDANEFRKQVTEIPLKTKRWFIFGSTSYEKSKGDINFFNSAYLLTPAGEIKSKYNKVHLVPYGEYVPLRNVFPFVKKLTEGMGDFTAGAGYYPLDIDNKKVGILICYEGILPEAARIYKNRGAELLVNITNDAWFGATSAPFQHFSMTIFRAVENRLYLARAANTGISAVINPKGEIVDRTDIFKQSVLKSHIKYSQIKTIYAKFGDILVYICFILLCVYFILMVRKKEKEK